MARKPFDEKMEYIKKKGGSSWIWTQYALNQEQWDISTIKEREKSMIEKLKKNFKF